VAAGQSDPDLGTGRGAIASADAMSHPQSQKTHRPLVPGGAAATHRLTASTEKSMTAGACMAHLREDELPSGRPIVEAVTPTTAVGAGAGT
jgi:hypothetical protein